MATKYFCDRCGKERDIWMVEIDAQGEEFNGELCQKCIDELRKVLKDFFGE